MGLVSVLFFASYLVDGECLFFQAGFLFVVSQGMRVDISGRAVHMLGSDFEDWGFFSAHLDGEDDGVVYSMSSASLMEGCLSLKTRALFPA